MSTKRALITGITGQDGSYLLEFLLKKGYEVHGLVRRSSSMNRERIDHLTFPYSKDPNPFRDSIHLHYGDLGDGPSLFSILKAVQPDEIYHLAAQSHVKVSFESPEYTAKTTALGTLKLLEAVRGMGMSPRIYQAGSSEMFGAVREIPQKETTPFYPRSPYGVAKVYAHWTAVNYREAYGMHICNGILFNHESPRRGESFVSRKITLAAAAIELGLSHELILGNLEAKRDWGFAGDYVEAMWLMLQHPEPQDFVIATGVTKSVRDFCECVFRMIGRDYREYVRTDPRFFRPTEVDLLNGDASRAREILGWKPKVSFEGLAQMMLEHDLRLLKNRSSAQVYRQPVLE